MLTFLRNLVQRLFGVPPPQLQLPAPPSQDQAEPSEEPEAEQPPAWALELMEVVQKSNRTAGRLGLKLEELERKVEGGFQDLRSTVKDLGTSTAAPSALDWDDLLDALDLLDAAVRSAAQSGQDGLAAGLEGIRQRLQRVLVSRGIQRHATVNGTLDGRLFKVVGTQPCEDQPDGVVLRLVRAAATQGGKLIREGEVIINRRAS